MVILLLLGFPTNDSSERRDTRRRTRCGPFSRLKIGNYDKSKLFAEAPDWADPAECGLIKDESGARKVSKSSVIRNEDQKKRICGLARWDRRRQGRDFLRERCVKRLSIWFEQPFRRGQ